MKLADLPTPCLVLDRAVLLRNIGSMAGGLPRHRVPLRPHMKTAKSIDVARLAIGRAAGRHHRLNSGRGGVFRRPRHRRHPLCRRHHAAEAGPGRQAERRPAARSSSITDDLDTARAIAAHPRPPRVLIEIDSGEARGGVAPRRRAAGEIAERLGPSLAGVMTHAGHSYAARGVATIAAASRRRNAPPLVSAAERLRAAGHAVPIVSIGSSPTACMPRAWPASPRCAPASTCSATCSRPRSRPTRSTVSRSRCWPASSAAARDACSSMPAGWPYRRTAAPRRPRWIMGLAWCWIWPAAAHSATRIVRRAYQEHGVIELDPAFPARPDGRRTSCASRPTIPA